MPVQHEHFCQDPENFDQSKFSQPGNGKGAGVLIVGESPAENGWRKSGKACYTPDGKLLMTGKRLNELLNPFELSVEACGFTELVKCFIGKDRHLLRECAWGCWPVFVKQLERRPVKLIILMGVKTLEIFNFLNKTSLPVGRISKTIIDGKSYMVLPIYHPSPVNPYSRAKNKEIFAQNDQLIRNLVQ